MDNFNNLNNLNNLNDNPDNENKNEVLNSNQEFSGNDIVATENLGADNPAREQYQNEDKTVNGTNVLPGQGVYSGQRYRYSSQVDSDRYSSGVYYDRNANQNTARNFDNNMSGKKAGSGFFWKFVATVMLGAILGVAAIGTYMGVNYFKNRAVTKADNQNEIVEQVAPAEENAKAEIPQQTPIEQPVYPQVMDVSSVVEKVMPSAVSITGSFIVSQQGFWGQIYEQEVPGSGSGIILAKDEESLLIATNNHVVENSNDLEVQFIDNTTAKARIKGTNPDMDLAVIVVNIKDLSEETKNAISVADLGDSNSLKIGEPAIAIGNSLGYGQTVTTGVISAVDRSFESSETGKKIEGLIQTDAAINPGNSGGALLNMYGQVIGINSSKIGGTTIDGVGFAIPISSAQPILSDIVTSVDRIKTMESNRGYLGIGGVSVTEEASAMYGMPVGVQVREIYANTGSAESDLQIGDIISKLNNKTVKSMEELQEELSYHEINEVVNLTVYRFVNGEYVEQSFNLRLSDKSLIGE